AGEAPSPRIGERDHADVDVTLLEDAVVGEQVLEIIADLEERIAKRGDVVDELRRQILMHAADAEISGMQADPGSPIVEPQKLFRLFEAPERRRERADIHSLRGHVEEVRQQPSNLAIEHADELRAPRHRKPEQLFRRQAEGMLLVYRGDIVEPV